MTTQHLGSNKIPPGIVKKLEQRIIAEAKNEEASLKNAIKDLTQTQKDENRAHKAAMKAERILEKSEQRERNTLKDLYRAETAYNVAVSNADQAQHNLKLSVKKHARMKEALETKSGRVDAAMQANDEHTKARNAKLTALRGPSAGDDAGRVIAGR